MKNLAITLFTAFRSCLAHGQQVEINRSIEMIPAYPDEWKLVEIRPKESPEIWMFRKNIGVSKIKANKMLPTLVYFTVRFNPKDKTGLPVKDDAEILYEFEEEVIPIIQKKARCVLVGSVIKGGLKDHLFYVSSADLFIDLLNNYRAKLKSFEVSLEKHSDPKWTVYDDFPGS